VARFAISYSPRLRWLFVLLGMGPRWTGVRVDDDEVELRMGWGFHARLPREAVRSVQPYDGRVWGWGAHGWRHRWLVNGSSKGIVRIHLEPRQRGRVMGVPVHVDEVLVSVEDRDGLLTLLTAGASR
jgi:hypothetical protein